MNVVARYKFLNGYDVLHPMGWDAFGYQPKMLPNQIIYWYGQTRISRQWKTNWNIRAFNSWDLEISTCDKSYYKHQQELFIDFYNKGYISRKETYVNWDPVEKTVLANEQVINGKGWRSNATVERKNYHNGF